MKIKLSLLIACLIFTIPSLVNSEEAPDKAFDDYINDSNDGSSFEEAIDLDDICDYSQCAKRKDAEDIFNRTVFKQECDYISTKFGIQGKDWQISGHGDIEAYTSQDGTYHNNTEAYPPSGEHFYDDLAVEIFATGEKKVLHFDITSPLDGLNKIS